jgi:hypothetical protein
LQRARRQQQQQQQQQQVLLQTLRLPLLLPTLWGALPAAQHRQQHSMLCLWQVPLVPYPQYPPQATAATAYWPTASAAAQQQQQQYQPPLLLLLLAAVLPAACQVFCSEASCQALASGTGVQQLTAWVYRLGVLPLSVRLLRGSTKLMSLLLPPSGLSLSTRGCIRYRTGEGFNHGKGRVVGLFGATRRLVTQY